ncbi:hypothetical protein Tco_1467849 [Tanacetum coccineum]
MQLTLVALPLALLVYRCPKIPCPPKRVDPQRTQSVLSVVEIWELKEDCLSVLSELLRKKKNTDLEPRYLIVQNASGKSMKILKSIQEEALRILSIDTSFNHEEVSYAMRVLDMRIGNGSVPRLHLMDISMRGLHGACLKVLSIKYQTRMQAEKVFMDLSKHKAWNSRFDDEIKNFEFQSNADEPCVIKG